MTAPGPDELAREARAFATRYGVPAVGAAIVTAQGPPVVAVTGVRVRGRAEPVTPDDRWHLGSCGKAITAALLARLVQRGLVRWDAPFGELFDDLGAGRHPGWRAVTVSDVLTHRSGLPANPTPAEMRAGQTDPAPPPVQRTALARRVLAAEPRHPGRFRYSNLGYTLVGAAVERLTGRPYETVLREEILRPLGMTSAGFGPPTGEQPWGHRPRLVFVGRGPGTDPARSDVRQPPDNPPLLTPAGRLHVTLADWAAFVRLFLDPPGDFLTAQSVAVITTPAPGSRQGMGWAVPADPGTAALGQQGSNLRWVATAAVAADRTRACLVVCNDGRSRLLSGTWRLATRLLGSQPPGAA